MPTYKEKYRTEEWKHNGNCIDKTCYIIKKAFRICCQVLVFFFKETISKAALELLEVLEVFMSLLSNMVATWHKWQLNHCNVAGATKELKF